MAEERPQRTITDLRNLLVTLRHEAEGGNGVAQTTVARVIPFESTDPYYNAQRLIRPTLETDQYWDRYYFRARPQADIELSMNYAGTSWNAAKNAVRRSPRYVAPTPAEVVMEEVVVGTADMADVFQDLTPVEAGTFEEAEEF